MKKSLRLWLAVVFTAVFGMANASDTQWYGYALYTSNSASWQNHFVSFNAQNPNTVQTASETLPSIWAATYLDGYVWFITQSRSLCKAPFDEETQTIGNYETVVPMLEQYNLYIDMAYNPLDGMMYYLCQDSQYNSYLKRSSLAAPSEVETVGMFSVKLWTLAINRQGKAYGVAYDGGNLYEINLNEATTTLVGPTGKDVWYTQSMAFDLDTGELYWAQFATASDHGFYQVNTETGEATSLGEIGQGTQLAGLFMVPQPMPEPEIINEIYVEGFTEPVWGEHPDFDLEVAADAHYSIDAVDWLWSDSISNGALAEEDVFNNEGYSYFMMLTISPEEGYCFTDETTVFYNGDFSPFAQGYIIASGKFLASTTEYYVTDPTFGITEQTGESIALWPNPATNILYLDVMEGTSVSIFDMAGRLVRRQPYEGQIDVRSLAPGIYAIRAEGSMIRFVKE
ncbi:MAG: T9SS type A sorting domain-containing protein [Bacteroidales bacterium]|nr:T9SS type A sorting domain-containing protein [Bacteroidales bacterium]